MGGKTVLYPGSFVDLAPSFAFESVTRSGRYPVRTDALDSYLVPRVPIEITAAMLHERGRGIAYTKSPFAYLFRRIA